MATAAIAAVIEVVASAGMGANAGKGSPFEMPSNLTGPSDLRAATAPPKGGGTNAGGGGGGGTGQSKNASAQNAGTLVSLCACLVACCVIAFLGIGAVMVMAS